jgi:lysozyme
VSHFQGDIDWQKIKDAQVSFVYDKATQGSTYKDPKYLKNKAGAQAVSLLHGSYHFFTSNEDAKEQAAHFVSVVDYNFGNLPPVLDLEQGSIKGVVDVPSFQKEVLIWLKEVENKLDIKPIIYTNHPFGEQYLNHSEFVNFELWIAEYGVEKPKIPPIWQEKGWLIWQRSDRGKVEGAVGDVDHDLYNPQKPFLLNK